MTIHHVFLSFFDKKITISLFFINELLKKLIYIEIVIQESTSKLEASYRLQQWQE